MASLALLVRLYPATWRERYGDEFVELLADRPPRLRDRLDIVVGAVDARLHPQVGRPAPSDAPMPRDRLAGVLLAIGGALLTLWAAIGLPLVRRWDSGYGDGAPQLLNLSWAAGAIGSIVIAVALLVIAARYDWSIGPVGAVGGVLTAAGLLFASAGGGVIALVLLGVGSVIFAGRLRGRLVRTSTALVLAAATFALIGGMAAFAMGGGQETHFLWSMIAYGPAWLLVALDLRAPVGSRIAPAEFQSAPRPTGA